MSEVVAEVPVKKGHPPGLYLLFFAELWERFSFYGMRGLLILFLTKLPSEGGMGIPSGDASNWYGNFQMLIYITPLFGGIIADQFLGQRLSILIGGVLMMLGQFSLASDMGTSSVFLGFGLLIFGNGFFKPNISTMVGSLYKQGDPMRDVGFTIFYMGINLGAFLAPLICGYLAEDYMAEKITLADGTIKVIHYGFRYGFMAAGIGMLLGQIIFNTFANKYLGDIGKYPAGKNKDAAQNAADNKPLSKEEQDRLVVIFVLCGLIIFFWAGFEQAGAALSLYTDSYIDRQVGNFLIPTSFFQAVNPLFIVALGPVVGWFWIYLAKNKINLSIPIKLGLGMILLGVGFLFMAGACLQRGETLSSVVPDLTIKASLWWLVLTYLFHTIGELFLSPIGLSMITRLSPVKFASMMMGIWFFSTAMGQKLAGYGQDYINELGPLKVFIYIAGVVTVFGFILFIISRKMVSMMHGRG
ncbi:MAG: peptide MFS transporter [Bacteroidota bacterium]